LSFESGHCWEPDAGVVDVVEGMYIHSPPVYCGFESPRTAVGVSRVLVDWGVEDSGELAKTGERRERRKMRVVVVRCIVVGVFGVVGILIR
jgi:hypothetical protein